MKLMEEVVELAGYQWQYFSMFLYLETVYSKPYILQRQWRFGVVRQFPRVSQGISGRRVIQCLLLCTLLPLYFV